MRLRLLLAVILGLSSWACGQACGELGMPRCAPPRPSTPSTPSGGPGNSPETGSGETRHERAQELNSDGFDYLKRFDAYGLEADARAASEAFREAWRLDGYGAIGMVELCNRTKDLQCTRRWAILGQKEKYNAKYTPEWLRWMEADSNADIYQLWYGNHCVLSTAPAGQGGVVDPSVNVQASLKECEKTKKQIAEFQKKAVEHHDKYLKAGGA